MKLVRIGLTAVIFSVALLHGETSINEQIKAIKEASAQERVELMNALKIRIASMNEGERIHSISALHTEMGGKTMPSGASPAVQRMQQMQSGQQGMNVQQVQSTQQSINVQQIQSRQQGINVQQIQFRQQGVNVQQVQPGQQSTTIQHTGTTSSAPSRRGY